MSEKHASVTTIVSPLPPDGCLPVEAIQARCEGCGEPIEVRRGHRPRRYCNDVCKQKAYQLRQVRKEAEARRARLRVLCPDLEEVTIELLDELAGVNNHELAQRVAAAIARQMEYRQQGLEQVQERFRSYVELTNERVGNLCGELAECRRELGRKPKVKMAQAEMRELEQARVDLTRLYQESARASEEIHQLIELTHNLRLDLGGKLGAARQRIAELEQQLAHPLLVSDLLFDLGAQLNYPELWFPLPDGKERVRILQGRVSWERFCERAAALEVRAAYEVAKQRVESNR